ncbi:MULTISPECIES: hypothetical protein [Sphingomonas]|uniref:Uncharacterized protein n=1 Tax=Sphingomonas kyungheensis TaxID=1069987 RepID=A0ABU8H3P0_9SPHN|nr:hypothetical protein [Sphingomonas sp. CV7422]
MSRDNTISTIERAFQLARAGACHSVGDIRSQLTAEGHDGVHGHLNGASIQRQLRDVLAARGVDAKPDDADIGS